MGAPLPPRIANAPELEPGLGIYMQAWSDLSTCRSMGGRIPWTAAMEYAARMGMDGEQAEDLWYYLTEMDMAYAKSQRKQ